MFPLSSQKKYWTFNNEQHLNELRKKQNEKFQETHGEAEAEVSLDWLNFLFALEFLFTLFVVYLRIFLVHMFGIIYACVFVSLI